MKNRRIFEKEDFHEYFKKVEGRFKIEERGVFLADIDEDEMALSEQEADPLREYPWHSRSTPALAFPFSYSDAEEFTNFFDLWGQAHMERLLCASGDILTLEQAAEKLVTDMYGVWRLMQPQNDPFTNQLLPVLQPSVFFSKAYLHWRAEDGRQLAGSRHGLFDLWNCRGLQADSQGVVKISFLEREGILYTVPEGEKLIVNVSRVYVTRARLDNYLQAIGKHPLKEEEAGEEAEPAEGAIAKKIEELNGKKKNANAQGLANDRHALNNERREDIAEIIMGRIDPELKRAVEQLRQQRKEAKLTINHIRFWNEAVEAGEVEALDSRERDKVLNKIKKNKRYEGYQFISNRPPHNAPLILA